MLVVSAAWGNGSVGDEEVGLERLLTLAECADCLRISEALQEFIATAVAGRQPEGCWSVFPC